MRHHLGRLPALNRAHPQVFDALLALFLLAAGVVAYDVTAGIFEDQDPRFEGASRVAIGAGLAGMIFPLALRRRFPLTMLLISTTAFLLYTLLTGFETDGVIPSIVMALAFYSAAAHGRGAARDWVCAVCVAAGVALTVIQVDKIGPGLPPLFYVLSALTVVALFCAMWALGAALGAGRRRGVELLERTVELESEREENARRAVFDERVRIARELHDVVAHHVSIMGVQAGAARLVMGRDPRKAEESLASIEASSREAVEELHRLLGFLRVAGEADDLAPRPGVSQVPELAARMSDSRLDVQVGVEGEERALPATVDVSAYRIVQEALTNTLKHAGASRAEIRLRYWPKELEVEVIDDGHGPGSDASHAGGLGIIGMRERAALHGGQLTAGPGRDGGFRVRATLPTPERAV